MGGAVRVRGPLTAPAWLAMECVAVAAVLDDLGEVVMVGTVALVIVVVSVLLFCCGGGCGSSAWFGRIVFLLLDTS